MLESLLLVILGLIGLFVGGDTLVKGAARLASAYGVPVLMIGLTIVAFGTSVPELLISVGSALEGVSDIALGNIVGSNIANVGLILGACGLFAVIRVEWAVLRREIPIMIGASILLLLLSLDGMLSQLDGALLLVLLGVVITYVYLSSRAEQQEIAPELIQYETEKGITPAPMINRPLEAGRIFFGIVLLFFGARWTVDGAVDIARALNVSDFVIGVTLVAVGTSLPELISSIVAAVRREPDIIIGNVIGSNVANILLILGLTAVLRPIPVAQQITSLDLPIMIGFALVLLPFLLRGALRWWQSTAFLIAYASYVVFTVTT
jgi:cation:H+ antiporter